ncbi:MAG: hypothetical protein QE278_11765 [Limnobacter sp.]|nr:hypothetical protein [Limnobacter sp.]
MTSDLKSESIFWVGEQATPESLAHFRQHANAVGAADLQLADFRLVRLQAEPSCHPLHPQTIGLIQFGVCNQDWSEWGAALLQRYPTTYLIRVENCTISVVKNHFIGLRFIETENRRLVQWPWFRASYFVAYCQQTTGLKRQGLFGPILSVASNVEGAWHCIHKRETHDDDRSSASVPPPVSSDLGAFVQFSLNDYAHALAEFLKQYRGELSISANVKLDVICSQAIPLALAQGYCSAELIGIWVMMGLIQAGSQQGLPQSDGNSARLLDSALQAGLTQKMLAALSQCFQAWGDVRFPWLSGASPHTIWDFQALSKIKVNGSDVVFNSHGIQNHVTLSPEAHRVEFQLMDDSGGSSSLFEPNQIDATLNHFLQTKQPPDVSRPLLPAVYKTRLVPTRLNSKPLGHVNLSVLQLEKPICLINRTVYGLTMSMPASGHQRLSLQQGISSVGERPAVASGLIANKVLDATCSPADPAHFKWCSMVTAPHSGDPFVDNQSIGPAWFTPSANLLKAAVLECREVFPAINIRMRWALSDCNSKVKLGLGLAWVWSEDFLLLSALAPAGAVDSTLRIRPSKAIDWRVDRDVEIPIEALKGNAVVSEGSISIPLEVMMDACSPEQLHQVPMHQAHLANRQCGEVQLKYQVIYGEAPSNLKLRVMAKVTPLHLHLHETHLTLGQQKRIQALLPEALIFGMEFGPHG